MTIQNAGQTDSGPNAQQPPDNDQHCLDCGGSGKCDPCEGSGIYTFPEGGQRLCRACRWRPTVCLGCRGSGKELQGAKPWRKKHPPKYT